MKMLDVSELYDSPLDPEAMQFTARQGANCSGCLFQRQRVSVCRRATQAALRAGLPDCDDGHVYVERELDARQLALVDGA